MLPFTGPIVTSSRYGRRFAAGHVDSPARAHVSRGMGVGHLPMRVRCPAELTLLTLTRPELEADDTTARDRASASTTSPVHAGRSPLGPL